MNHTMRFFSLPLLASCTLQPPAAAPSKVQHLQLTGDGHGSR